MESQSLSASSTVLPAQTVSTADSSVKVGEVARRDCEGSSLLLWQNNLFHMQSDKMKLFWKLEK